MVTSAVCNSAFHFHLIQKNILVSVYLKLFNAIILEFGFWYYNLSNTILSLIKPKIHILCTYKFKVQEPNTLFPG